MSFTEQFQNATWSDKIRVLRALKNWSQDEAAEHCGTVKRIYWNWENGEHYPAKRNRKMIASAFGIPETDIFGEQQIV
jgi:transcriptional regulator with XRE-family HTH domain